MTFVDIVDELDHVIGKAHIDEKEKARFISRNVVVFIQDRQGKFVICKRGAHKRIDPNLYDASVCGNVDSGEGYQDAAQRELREELGIFCTLKEVGVFYHEFHAGSLLRRHFTGVFLGRSDDDIILSDEASGYWKFSLADLHKMMVEEPESFSEGFIQEIEYFFRKECS
jgi:isopentenyldiphosphate isomerase